MMIRKKREVTTLMLAVITMTTSMMKMSLVTVLGRCSWLSRRDCWQLQGRQRHWKRMACCPVWISMDA